MGKRIRNDEIQHCFRSFGRNHVFVLFFLKEYTHSIITQAVFL